VYLPVTYHDDYVVPLPENHRFPMDKFRRLYYLLLKDGVISPATVFRPELPPLDWLELVHTPAYVSAYLDGTLDAKAQRRIGLPWSIALARRTQIALSGTVLAAKLALEKGIAANTAGGTHHAFPDYGSGFCIFNDLAVTARVLQKEGLVDRVFILDLDVHQGDGTAYIFQNDESVFTFSMHCETNFPNVKQSSDCDVPLKVGMEDEEYLITLSDYLPDLLSAFKPDIVLYDAGVDTHADDRLGKLNLTDSGLFRRDMQVLTTCTQMGYPVACTIGGGYADDLDSLVYRHSLVHRAASEVGDRL
jgi:acetoin utilization deacetylase AcuC-like enzyme